MTINKNKERVLDIWYYNGRIFFLTHTELGNQRVSARLRIIQADNSDLNVYTEDIIILNENRFSRNFTYNSRRNSTFNLSRKDSSLSIWHINPPETMDAKQSVTSHMYNNEMKLIDKAIIDLPEVAKLCEVLRVDDLDGDEFLICTKEYAINPIDKRGFSPNYKFVFYVANPSKEQLSSFTYKDENVYLERPKLKWNKGVLEATGLFADKLEGPKIGIWFLRYNFNTKTLMSDTLQYFDKNVRALPGNGFQASLLRNSKFESFYIDYFIKVSPNKRMVVAEQFFLLPASFGSSYTYNRFYGDILILYMDENGVINNAHRLIKAQQTFNNFGEFSSYYLERKDTMLKFIYNDNSRNKDTYRFKHLVWHKHSNINVSEVTAGSTYNYSISNYKLAGGIIQVRDMEKIGPDTYLIYANKKKKGKLGIMKLQP